MRVRRNARARKMILRIDADCDGVVVTLPPRVPEQEALALVRLQAHWITERLETLQPRVTFADGALVPFLGRLHRVRHRPDACGTVWLDGEEIHVAGQPEHLARRLNDWLRREARSRIGRQVANHAATLNVTVRRITIRDTRSRWGSCSSRGDLSFSWRLVMMPEEVLDYVAAHEVAHRLHHDHGPGFWDAVARLVPNARSLRAWLRTNGPSLHRYGRGGRSFEGGCGF